MTIVYLIFSVLLIWLSFRSFCGGLDYLAFFRTELAKPLSAYMPKATIIAPCRGIDEGFHENLTALIEQEYPEFEVIFVVDDADDEAVETINLLIASTSNAKLIVAQKATNSSQKVENLREAVLHAADDSKVFVFVDSDARPQKHWLRRIVAPLENNDVGAATGYRWFISPKSTVGSELRSAWNASIASALGPNTASNFCWGGSMAIRRDVFDDISMRERWAGTLSDDFVVTNSMKEVAKSIVFVPQALAVTYETCSFRSMLEFTTRQMKITRVYATPLWLLSFFGSTVFLSVIVASIAIMASSRMDGWLSWFAFTTVSLVFGLSIGKAFLRLKAVRLALPNWDNLLKKQTFPQITLFLVAPAVFLYNCVAALISRRINWRGTVYELKSRTETVIISSE
ncbi:MAG TPA: glycosyltransferase family 2 protein [Pyrinomonadaceae bacterium]|nr:glycosyltransferase family 2 protein [Pyrinomonadaceae bacterium]